MLAVKYIECGEGEGEKKNSHIRLNSILWVLKIEFFFFVFFSPRSKDNLQNTVTSIGGGGGGGVGGGGGGGGGCGGGEEEKVFVRLSSPLFLDVVIVAWERRRGEKNESWWQFFMPCFLWGSHTHTHHNKLPWGGRWDLPEEILFSPSPSLLEHFFSIILFSFLHHYLINNDATNRDDRCVIRCACVHKHPIQSTLVHLPYQTRRYIVVCALCVT